MKKLIKKHLLFLVLIPLTIISQNFLLEQHYLMGLNDLDEGYTVDFNILRQSQPNYLDFLVESYKNWGAVYLHQYYYPSILNHFYGDNIPAYHTITHIFKILTILASYFFFVIVSGSSLIAFVAALLFAFSYVGIGAFDSVAQSSDYPAILMLFGFLSVYFYLIKNNLADIKRVLVAWFFLVTSLVFSTERTYPVVILILVVELGLILWNKSRKSAWISFKRLRILILPILFLVLLQPRIILGMLTPSWRDLTNRITSGQQEQILFPFVALTSTFLPGRFWIFDVLLFASVLKIITLLLSAFLLAKNPLKFMLITIGVWFSGAIFVKLLSQHAEYFINFARIAESSFFILGLATAFLIEWLTDNTKIKKQSHIGLFLGPFGAFIFIYSIWLGTGERGTIFMDTHRYLATAVIFSSFFIGTFLVVICQKLKIRPINIIPIILTFPIFLIDSEEIQKYFDSKLSNGLARKDQIFMRQQLLPYYRNIDPQNRRLFYIDMEYEEKNGAFYGNTIYAGYNAWPLWWPHLKGFQKDQMPYLERNLNNIRVLTKDGKTTIYNAERYFKPEDFYAFKLRNKKVIDITAQIKKELNLND